MEETTQAIPAAPAAAPSPASAALSAPEPALERSEGTFEERKEAFRAEAEAERAAAEADALPSSTPADGGGEPAAAAPEPSDDEPNPALPKLTRGETKKLFEQWEAERRPRFFADLEAAQREAARLAAEAQAADRADAEARAGYDHWYGPDHEYAAAQQVYDQIVARVARGEYVPDAEVAAAQQFVRWRENRGLAGAVNQRELGKVLANVDACFRRASVEGVDVPQVLAEVSSRRGTPGDVLAEVGKRVRALVESEWKGKYEAEREAHAATRQRLGLGRAVSGVSGGRPPARGDLVATAMGGSSADRNDLIERAKRGELAGLDLSDR